MRSHIGRFHGNLPSATSKSTDGWMKQPGANQVALTLLWNSERQKERVTSAAAVTADYKQTHLTLGNWEVSYIQ